MEAMHNNFNRTITILILVCFFIFFVPFADAKEPSWEDVPHRLKTEEGTESKGEFLYATGLAAIERVRPDKAHEMAKKKSLFHSLQLVHMASSCKDALAGLSPEEHRNFVRLFVPFVSAIKFQGITVIRQWEVKENHFTTVAVPLSAIKDVPCEFPDVSTAVERYLMIEQPSLDGLSFCLSHVPHYSNLNRKICARVGKWFQDNGQKQMALCFRLGLNTPITISEIETLVLQNYTYRAERLTEKAEKQAKKGQWEDAVINASEALELVPAYGRAFLVLSDFFLLELKKPVFALCAVEKAMRTGSCFKEALDKKVSILRTLGSPEAEICQFLLSQCELLPESEYFSWEYYSWAKEWPSSWRSEMKRLGDRPIPNLVVASLGQAEDGDIKLPDEEFVRAVAIFNKAKTDEDVEHVLDLLLSACEKQPDSPKTYNLIGACYRHLGKYEMALPFLWQALKLDPEYNFALTNLGLCCSALGLDKSASYYFNHDAVKTSTNNWVKESYARFKTKR